MAMTLRLGAAEERALSLLATAWEVSKQEAVRRSIVAAATRLLDDATVDQLARDILDGHAQLEERIAAARPGAPGRTRLSFSFEPEEEDQA